MVLPAYLPARLQRGRQAFRPVHWLCQVPPLPQQQALHRERQSWWPAQPAVLRLLWRRSLSRFRDQCTAQPNNRCLQVEGKTGECDTDGKCYLGLNWYSVMQELGDQMDRSFVSNSGADVCWHCKCPAGWMHSMHV